MSEMWFPCEKCKMIVQYYLSLFPIFEHNIVSLLHLKKYQCTDVIKPISVIACSRYEQIYLTLSIVNWVRNFKDYEIYNCFLNIPSKKALEISLIVQNVELNYYFKVVHANMLVNNEFNLKLHIKNRMVSEFFSIWSYWVPTCIKIISSVNLKFTN